MWQAYSTDPRVNRPTVRKDPTRSGFTLADTLSDSAGVAYSDKVALSPEEIAQHAFAGPDMEAFLSNLAGKKVIMGGGTSRPRGRSLAEPMVPAGGSDGGYQNAVNAYLSELTDRNAAGQAQHEAQFADEQKQQAIDRAMAIANDPNTSQFGRPIVPEGPMALGPSGRPVSASGTYATAPPAENAPPVNRQAVAAQMAPGLIAPPPPAPPVTFGAPVKATVNGKSVFVRPGSDGQTYDMSRRPVDVSKLTPEPDQEPLETVIGPDGKPIRVKRSDAIGKEPAAGTMKASTGVQKRVLNFFNRAQQADSELEDMEAKIQELGLVGQGRMALAPNIFQSQLGQSYQAAQRAFTEARLRKDSGAAIPPHEFDSDRQTYFAQPGDSKETLEQKRRARGAMLASLGFESGQALGEFVGDENEAKAIVQGYKDRAAGKKVDSGAGGGMIRAVDPQGNVHEAKAGTPLPAGWKLQGGG